MTLYLNNITYPMLGHLQLEQITVDDVRRTIWQEIMDTIQQPNRSRLVKAHV